MEPISLVPIGIIRTPHKNLEGMPIQPSGAEGILGTVEVEESFREGLLDLDGFSHIYLLYFFHLSKSFNLVVKPFLDNTPHGVFATRAPKRPNPIGISVVSLLGVDDRTLRVEGVDMADGTPLLDIKPSDRVAFRPIAKRELLSGRYPFPLPPGESPPLKGKTSL